MLSVDRVTKVITGGKRITYRALVGVGNGRGTLGLGMGKSKELLKAVDKAKLAAKKNLVTFPLTKTRSIPHAIKVKYGAAKVFLCPKREGSGIAGGGAVREVLELAGVENAIGKMFGSNSILNNAKATMKGLSMMRTPAQVAADRTISLEQLIGKKHKAQQAPEPEQYRITDQDLEEIQETLANPFY